MPDRFQAVTSRLPRIGLLGSFLVRSRLPRSLAETLLYGSLLLMLALLIWTRPPVPFYALLLAPIALAAILYEFVGGTLVALAAVAGVAVLLALDPDAARRAQLLGEAWPILLVYLIVGPVVGWVSLRDRERDRELVAAARRLHIVQEVAQAINTSLDLDQILQAIFSEIGRLISFQQAVVMLYEANELRVVATSLPTQMVGYTFPLPGTAAGNAILQGKMQRLHPEETARYPDARMFCPSNTPCLIIPLHFKSDVIGILALAGKRVTQLPRADLNNLDQIVAQMAVALEHARLFELQRTRSRALMAISEASREIAISLNLERTLRQVMSKAAETLPMDAGALLLLNDERQMYRVAVTRNLSAEHVDKIRFALNEGVPGWVGQHRQALVVPDASADPRVHPDMVADGVQSVLAIPLVARERLVGVLNLFCKTAACHFDEETLHLAQAFANQAAVFIENARLVGELREAASDLEARVERRTQQLHQTQKQAMRAEKMALVGRLAASVAHEVNNPLQAIALHLALLNEEGLTTSGQEQMGIVQEELSRIAGIVQRLLDFQRPQQSQQTLRDLTCLLDDVLALSDKQLQQANVRVIQEGSPDLPPVMVDADQFKQLFLNLILNAVEAMPDGGELYICTAQSDEAITVSFKDSGIGMGSEVMDQLFEPFFSTKHDGTGLGLAICHDIIMEHGGTLAATSLPGQGSTFTVTLPLNGDLL